MPTPEHRANESRFASLATHPAAGGATLGRSLRLLRCAAGLLVLAVGLALLVLPGPGLPVILGALVLLAPHSRWARRALAALRRGRLAEALRMLWRVRYLRRPSPRPHADVG